MNTHTPGPWRINAGEQQYVGPDDEDIVTSIYWEEIPLARLHHCETRDAEANARLIAKAPDMARMLSELAAPHQTAITADDQEQRCGICEEVVSVPDDDESADIGHNSDCSVIRARALLASIYGIWTPS